MPENTIPTITDQKPAQNIDQITEAAETARRLLDAALKSVDQTNRQQPSEPRAPEKPVESLPPTPPILPAEKNIRPYADVKSLLEPRLTPVTISGLSTYSVGYLTAAENTLASRASLYTGSAILTGLGVYQGFRDVDNLNRADSTSRRVLFGTALAADAGVVSAGVMSMAKFGPRWLAPTLMIGALSTRAMLDFAEISTRKLE